MKQQRCNNNKRDGETRTLNMYDMSVTLLVSQLPMGWLKASAYYSTEKDGRVE